MQSIRGYDVALSNNRKFFKESWGAVFKISCCKETNRRIDYTL